MNVLWIALLGVAGVLSRYGLDSLAARQFPAFPYGTFVINVIGSALAGVLFTLSAQGRLSAPTTTALLVGFCGGFTTFSAYSVHTLALWEKGQVVPAVAYFVLSPLLGLLATFAGASLVKGLA